MLTLLDLGQPTDYAAEGYRVLWTLCGVGIGVLVRFLASLLARRTAKAPPPNQPERGPLTLASVTVLPEHQRGPACGFGAAQRCPTSLAA